jgi:hypothetical protein
MMEAFYEQDKVSLTELERYILSKCNTKLPAQEMFAEFLERAETDTEIDEYLNKYNVVDIQLSFTSAFSKYMGKLKYPKTINRVYDYEFVQYNKYNLVQLKKNQETIVMNNKICVRFSKTSWDKFNKHFNLDDITRVRLYQMYYNHTREDDNFMKVLKDNKISYTTLDTIDPLKFLKLYKDISI